VTEDLGWHAMECGLCPETWWIPFGVTVYGTQEIERAAEHWRGHRDRGEDPRYEAIKAGKAVSEE